MLLLLLLSLLFIPLVCTQLTPLLIGSDIFTPPLTFCNKPDIVNASLRISQCNLYRSISCNTTNYRCSLNPNFFNDTTNNGTFVNEMIKFTVKTWAELMPGTADGKAQVNVQYNFPNVFFLNGYLQLWKYVSGTSHSYNFTLRQYELRTIDAPNNLQQTYLFHGLTAGQYVFSFWDNGGTKQGNALPEFSQAFYIKRIFSIRTLLTISFIPMNINSSMPDYDTNYKRGNKNFISYQLNGSPGFQTLFNIATGPDYNRQIFWEYRTDQGNLINAKTTVETVPAAAAADGFVDTMFKFKIFPAMCCSRRTSISARLVYADLFPASYSDYYKSRQRYGYGTVLDRRVIVHNKLYFEDTVDNAYKSPFDYERWVQRSYGDPASEPAHTTVLKAGVYVCMKDTPVLNTLTSSGNTDTYQVTTLRRNYCECFNRAPLGEPYVLCIYARDQLNVAKEQEAFKSPLGSNTNNFDQYDDYRALNDYSGKTASAFLAYGIMGRPFLTDVDFTDFDNNDADDYSCNPFTTLYTDVYPSISDASSIFRGDGKTVFSPMTLTKQDLRRVYDVSTPSKCDVGGTYPDPPSYVSYGTGTNTGGISPANLWSAYFFNGADTYGTNPCTCLRENAFYIFRFQQCGSGLQPSIFQLDYNWLNSACTYVGLYSALFFDASVKSCSSFAGITPKYLRVTVGTPVWGADFLKPFYERDWRGNLRPNQFQVIRASSTLGGVNTVALSYTQAGSAYYFITTPGPTQNTANYCRDFKTTYQSFGYTIHCINVDNDLLGAVSMSFAYSLYSFVKDQPLRLYAFNQGVSSASPVPFTQNTPFSFVYDKVPPTTNPIFLYEYPPKQGIYGKDPLVFGTTGLDTFIATVDTSFSPTLASETAGFDLRTSYPTYPLFKVIPEIEFFEFLNIDAGVAGVRTPTIDIVFRISCPVIDMDETNNNGLGTVGYCAQNWIITNQYKASIVVAIISGPTMVSEPQIPTSFSANTLLGDVYDTAVFQIRLNYNDGDTLSWYFFPKTEPEKPAGIDFCGKDVFQPYSGILKAYYSITVPTQSISMLPMIANIKSVPPACEYNQAEMLFSVFRGQCFAYEVVAYQNLPNYDLTGTPLDYGRGTNYWFDVYTNGTKLKGTSIYHQPYAENTQVTVFDQVSYIANLPVPPPDVIANYTNPMARATYCLNDTSQGICYAPDDDSEDTTVSGIDQWHYFDAGINQLYLTMRFIMNPGFSKVDNIGAYYCNKTEQFVDVAIWDIQNKPLFIIQDQCVVPQTAYYTYTVKYGKAIAGFTNGQNYPCLERYITYAIILSSFRAAPSPIRRIENCTEINNCCYTVDFQVTGNTAVSNAFVNMDNCTRAECLYEIKTSPMPNNTWGGLCLGVVYTFTIQSPAALVAARTNQNDLPFHVPWRGPAIITINFPQQGFGFVPVETTNGNCEEQGSFVDIDFTYTDPTCTNQIDYNNSNPICRFDVLLAIEPINNAVQYTQTQARLNNPLLLNGTNTPVYNILNSIKFPEILNDPDFLSIPDGSYALYIWLSTPGAYQSFSTVIVHNATRGVATEFAAFFSSANGLSIIRVSLTYPRCPATAAQILAITDPSEYPLIFITTVIDIIDQAFNGPYNLTFLSPSGALVHQVLLEGIVVCNSPCAGFFPLQNNQSCAACDEFMRSQGYRYTLYVGTGVISAGETGLFFVRVQAVETVCVATYPEYIYAMNTLSVSLNCRGPQCTGQQSGLARSYAFGGTMFPFLLSDFTQNSDRTVAVIRYTYNWTVYTLNGTKLNNYTNILYIPFAGAGIYDLELSDYNKCRVNVSCIMQPQYTTLELELVGSVSPNCTGEQGAITVRLVNKTGYPPGPYILYKVGVDRTPVMTSDGYILTDQSVTPGEQFFYMVCSTIGCCSQLVNLSLTAPVGFEVRIATAISPCSSTSATGKLVAVVVDSQGNPIAVGVTYQWYFNEVLLPITVDTVNGASAGVYRVVATSIQGCSSSESIALFAMSDIAITYERTPVNIDPGEVAGSIFGGNGIPYSIYLFPDTPPDDINEVVIVYITQSAILTTFKLLQVPSQATLIMRVTDSAGCQNQFELTGGRIPDTEPIEPPSPSPSPTPIKVPKEPHDLLPVLLIAMLIIFMFLGLVFAYAIDVRKTKYVR